MISVIIPCYNFGHLIAETINSVLNQTYNDLEIIVINDGSKDNTEKLVNEILEKDSRVRYYFFANAGLATSRNRGLNVAKGEYIQFLDADDLLEKSKFEKQLELFSIHPLADIVYGSVRYFEKEPYNTEERLMTYWGKNDEWMPKYSGLGRKFLHLALKGNFSHLSSPLFRRSIVDRVGLFDNEISAVADYHFLLRTVIANAYFLYSDLPDTYSLVRWHPDNMSKDPTFMRKEEIKMRHKLIPLLQGNEVALQNNENAIKGLTLLVEKSWKRIFLSGGPFDFIKSFAKAIGLEKIAQRLFYR